jgi:hypothetical protein
MSLAACSTNPSPPQLRSDAWYLDQLHKIYTPGENGSRFLSKVQKLATSVDIYDPDAVSKVLSMHFTESERSFPPYGSDCSDSYAEKAAGAHIFIPTASWFKQSPEGVPEMFVPAMFINPAFKQGNPSFSYSITRTEMCTGRMDLRNHQQASIKFDNLSGFSCLTPAELVHELHAQYQMATDGFSSYMVSGQSSDRFGSGLTFVFRAGAPCALRLAPCALRLAPCALRLAPCALRLARCGLRCGKTTKRGIATIGLTPNSESARKLR